MILVNMSEMNSCGEFGNDFSKDIGMPLTESINFWSKEYAQSTDNCTSCSHSWQKDGRKYVYSLRHLYGLEGSRREYHTPGCKQVQVSII